MKILLLGDVCPTDVTAPLYAERKTDELFGDVPTLFAKADWSFVNLECAITDSPTPIKKFGPNLAAPRQTAQVLKEIGVSCCGLSNNHIFDLGPKGVRDTLSALDEVGISYTGFGKNYEDSRRDLVIEKDGQSICIIAVCEHEYSYALENRMGSRPFDEYDTLEDVRAAKAKHDRVIVIYHGGKEMCQYPSPRLRKLSQALVRAGADVVIGQHSHCISCYEEYKGGHILYGQGNFHFVKPSPREMWHSCLAFAYDTEANTVELTPIECTATGIRLSQGENKDKLMREFAERNASLHDGTWRDGWHAFCEENSQHYLESIGKAGNPDSTVVNNARFGHYLDCEAHLDVYRELFPTWNATNCLGEEL